VIGLDLDRKAKHLATVAGVSDQIAARALITYHLAEQRPMMGAFLDALGIAHENGLIQEENVKPDTAKIKGAVEKISADFPKEDVRIYLNTLVCQDPETWGGLGDSITAMEAGTSG
jgi:hypothetical protein